MPRRVRRRVRRPGRFVVTGEYLPGYGETATRMLTARTAEERLGFLPATVIEGARVLDVGCGPGALTAGLARRIGPAGTLVALDAAAEHLPAARAALLDAPCRRVVVRGSVPALPLPDRSVDVVVAHALIEHLADPIGALAAMRRVLVPGGTLGVVASDWSGARHPDSPDAAATIAAYRRVRTLAGGHPDAGAHLAGWVRAAGLDVVGEAAHHRRDMTGPNLAAYLAARAPSDAARRWAAAAAPTAVDQRWVEVLATARCAAGYPTRAVR